MKTSTFFLLLLFLPGAGARAASDGTLADAWQLLANYRPDLALPRFEELAARGDGNARAARLGTALSLLAQPSAVPDRVGKARVILTALAADGADDISLAAQFYLARVAEFQSDPPNPGQAAAGFQRLIAEHPDSVWAQAAVPRLAILLLYTAAGPADPAGRVAAAEQLLGAAHLPSAVADLHLVISDAIFHYRLPDSSALPHLLAAEQTAVLDPATRADVLVQTGELARLAHNSKQAVQFFQTFLTEYPRDARQFPVHQRLAALAGGR